MYPFINILGKSIPTYGLCMLIGLFVVAIFGSLRARKKNIPVENVIVVLATSLAFILLGGGLLYIFVTYSFGDIVEFVSKGDFSFLTSGGIVFYGGLFGAVVGALLGAEISKTSKSDICETMVPFVPFAHAVGRVGCFLAGCCNGMEYEGFGAVYYKNSIFGLSPHQGYFPVQLAEAALNCIIGTVLVVFSKKAKRKADIVFLYLLLYGFARFGLEYLRGDEIRGIYFGISTSQWISICLVICAVGYFAAVNVFKRKNNA